MLILAGSMFALGLVTSVHCVSMCGPLILTYAVSGGAEGPWYRRLLPHLAYHGSRFLSYALIGLLLGAVGSLLNLGAIRPVALFVAGGLMIVLALGMTGRVRWARYLSPRPPTFLVNALRRTRRTASADAQVGRESLATPVVFGLLTGLLPCGPAIAAELASAASGSALAGAIGMLAFGLGTAPLLLAFGTGASLIPAGFKSRMNLVLALAVMVWGVIFLNQGLMAVGSPLTIDSARAAVMGIASGPSGGAFTTAADGVVEVQLALMADKYVPESVVIPANKPVRLMVKRQVGDCAHDGMCAARLVIPSMGVDAALRELSVTAVDLPAVAPGTYTMMSTCGMMHGLIVAK